MILMLLQVFIYLKVSEIYYRIYKNKKSRCFSASYTIYHPSFDQNILNPNERMLDISTNYSYVKKYLY
jgi:hypothetical protein